MITKKIVIILLSMLVLLFYGCKKDNLNTKNNISGYVYEKGCGNAIPGIKVQILFHKWYSCGFFGPFYGDDIIQTTITDENGKYEIKYFPDEAKKTDEKDYLEIITGNVSVINPMRKFFPFKKTIEVKNYSDLDLSVVPKSFIDLEIEDSPIIDYSNYGNPAMINFIFNDGWDPVIINIGSTIQKINCPLDACDSVKIRWEIHTCGNGGIPLYVGPDTMFYVAPYSNYTYKVLY